MTEIHTNDSFVNLKKRGDFEDRGLEGIYY